MKTLEKIGKASNVGKTVEVVRICVKTYYDTVWSVLLPYLLRKALEVSINMTSS